MAAGASIRGGTTLGLQPAALIAQLGIASAIRRGLNDAALELEREWKKIFPAEGSGRVYTHEFVTVSAGGGKRVVPIRPRQGAGMSKEHRASKHPEAPAIDTGDLRSSIGIEALPDGRVRVGTGVESAKYLEFGVGPSFRYGPHPAGVVLRPRPHARPAAQIAEPKMRDAMVGGLKTS